LHYARIARSERGAKKMAYIIVDVVDEDMSVEQIAAVHNLTAQIINANGPAGGWPEVKMSGSRSDLQAFIDDNGYECVEIEG
jgi:hypothetical protein